MRPEFLTLTGVLVAGLGLSACQVQDAETKKKLDEISKKLDDLDKKVAAGGMRPQQPMQPPPGPDPNSVYAVNIAGSAYVGPEHAKVTIVEAFEFAWPFCERVRGTLDQLEKDYGKDLKVVYKHYVVHPQIATLPAQAACAAQRQGKFKPMMEGLWEKGYKNNRNYAQDNLDAIAKDAGLNMDKFKSDMSGECVKAIQQDQSELAAVGVRGTPAFYINGRYLSGAQPIENFKKIIDEELKKANEAIEKGMKVENYYSEVVMKNGKKSI